MLRTALALLVASIGHTAPPAPDSATYDVRMLRLRPLAFSVSAALPQAGSAVLMATTRPGDLPELARRGWPALVRDLVLRDSVGRELEAREAGPAGWQLAQPYTGRLAVTYVVDYAAAAARDWPAPRELAYVDSAAATLVARSLFVTTEPTTSVRVRIRPLPGWHVVAPWRPAAGEADVYRVEGVPQLTENILAIERALPAGETAGGFHVLVTAFGDWRPARPLVRQVLAGVLPRFVRRMAYRGSGYYHVVLLPQHEVGGESYRASFALTFDTIPTAANRAAWGNTIAHELFHQWNGWRLQGADYASSQWFQEGFTEYEANLALLAGGLMTPDAFRRKLAQHVANAARLQTPLDAPGTHKGPPLYSAGALVAFSWDVMIREATGGKRDLGDFWRALLRLTGQGARPYAWPDIEAALAAKAPGEWSAFHASYIHGREPLPLERVLALVGLRLERAADAPPRIEPDPAAPRRARALWTSLARRE